MILLPEIRIKYRDLTIKKGTVIYRGEQSCLKGCKCKGIPQFGYRPGMTAYLVDVEIAVMGCVYEQGKWKVYKTKGRGGHYIIKEIDSEDKAFIYVKAGTDESIVRNN